MEAHSIPKRPAAIAVSSADFEICFADEAKTLSFVMPPVGDISEMEDLKINHFSLKEHASRTDSTVLLRELDLLTDKQASVKSARLAARIASVRRALRRAGPYDALMNTKRDTDSQVEVTSPDERDIISSADDGALDSISVLEARASGGDSDAAVNRAIISIRSRNMGEAAEWSSRAVALRPDGYAECLLRGAIELLGGNYSVAIVYFKIALEERPTSSHAYTNLAIAYLGLGGYQRAFSALKRAVALDPFNENALVLMADVAFYLKRDSEVVDNFLTFVEFEQKSEAVWQRFARSLIGAGRLDQCIAALQHQGAIRPSLEVWNNLGVAYFAKRDYARGIQCLKHALIDAPSESADPSRNPSLYAVRNLAHFMSVSGAQETLASMYRELEMLDRSGALRASPKFGDFYIYVFDSLYKTSREAEARSLLEAVISDPRSSPDLVAAMVSMAVARHALHHDDEVRLRALIDRFYGFRMGGPEGRNVRVANNFAFSLIELGRLEEAGQIIESCANELHRDAYLTATFGLLNMRRGSVERGIKLYEEAIGLASSNVDRARIRQKMHLELGKIGADSPSKVRSYLKRAMREVEGENVLREEAKRVLEGFEADTRLRKIKKERR